MSFNSPHADLLFKATQVPSLASVLSGLASAQEDKVGPIQLTSVTQAAWPFLGAALSISLQPARSIWFICDDAKKQEDFFCELRLWLEPKEMAFFPDLGMTAEGLGLPDPEVLSERLAFLGRLAAGEMLVAVISISALSQRVLSKNDLTAGCWTIDVGWKGSPGQLAQQLYHSHFTRTDSVASRGECALRGGILDFFSWQEELPCRVEFDEEKIISMRYFDSDTQISTQEIQTCTIQSSESEREPLPFIDYIAANDLIVILGDHFNEEAKKQIDQLAAQKIHFLDYSAVEVENQSRSGKRDLKTSTGHLNYHRQMIEVSCYPIPFAQFGAGDFVMQEARRKQFFDQLGAWQKANQHILFFSNTESEGERFVQLVCENKEIPLFNHSFLEMRLGGIAKGFSFPEAQLSILAHAEIFGCSALHQAQRWHRRREEQRAARSAINFSEFEEGDFVVHTEYGIAFYQGLQRFSAADGTIEEVLVLEFQDEAKLFVPLDQAWQVSRYVGIGKATPSLSSLNDERWGKTRALTEKSVFLYAGKLLKLQAERETQKGYAFGPDTPWQKELEQNFPFSETLDQLRAISEIKQDMESSLPMDRLLCGDVGFGKTEVALRAVFKAVMAGKQAIFLAPTTVLAQQHYQTLAQRMSPYPLKIELMSRYRTAAEQRKVIQGLADGTVDIVIGTHRLFSSDIIFKNLGLVVVDEEQRFGVKHKEAFKERFRLIDILTLSATPIPRTL
ncbi:MAG: DEAD/DEAH box helicase, partial [Chthoniobacterales bacterium]